MERLQEELDALLAQLPNREEFQDRLDSLVSVYPFNEYEYVISTLLAMDVLTLDGYHELRDSYIGRNLYLSSCLQSAHLVLLAERGRSHGPPADAPAGHGHLKGLVPGVQKPSDAIDPDYSGQYDLSLEGIGADHGGDSY